MRNECTPPSASETILETFDGYVDRVDGGTAHVTLTSNEHKDVLWGEYSAAELAALGITEGRRFLCRVVKRGQWTRIDFQAAPRREVTDEEARAIKEEIEAALPGGDTIEY